MITVNQLRQYLQQKLIDIPSLKSQQLIIDDSELSKFLKDSKESDSPMLFGVMPAYPISGNEDAAMWNNKLMFMILDKTTYRDNKHEEYLDIFHSTQAVMRDFVHLLLEEKANAEGLFCNSMERLQEDSINIYPIWKKQGTNGWAVELDVVTRV